MFFINKKKIYSRKTSNYNSNKLYNNLYKKSFIILIKYFIFLRNKNLDILKLSKISKNFLKNSKIFLSFIKIPDSKFSINKIY